MRVAITGGTGFVGLYLSRHLVADGHDLVLVGRGNRKRRPRPGVDVRAADVISGEGLEQALAGCDAVVNLVAIIKEKGKQTFDAVNRQGTEHVAAAARSAGVPHLIQLSAIGADPDPAFPYLRSKWGGEQAIRTSGIPHTIIRSSLIFGPGDEFFTKLRGLLRLTPFILPIAGDGHSQFQPIAAEDVARCIAIALARGPSRTISEIGGPEQYSYQEMLEIIATRYTNWPRVPVHVPLLVLATAAHVPNPFVTPTQVAMLRKHNITRRTAVRDGFGFEPASFADSLEYLADY
ncbi:MAG: complex I NDUFA9 subunit family protein [Candidatus Dormibacteria bacterium]